MSVYTSSVLRLQEPGLQLQLGNAALQINENDYSILSIARKQLSTLPSAQSLYVKAKNQLRDYTKSQSADTICSVLV